MKIIFIAGPYMGKSFMAIERNIRKAEAAAIELWNAGYGVFCPHLNTAHFEVKANADEEAYKEFDLRMLKGCDAVFVLDGWPNSSEARAEAQAALEVGIPVCGSLGGLRAALCGEQESGPCAVEVRE